MNTYKCWAKTRGKLEDIENYEPMEFNQTLQGFFAEAKKKQDGKDYEPSLLAAMQAGIERYSKE